MLLLLLFVIGAIIGHTVGVAEMEELIVLGLIPGTSVQVDFYTWLIAACSISIIRLLFAAHRRHTLRNLILLLFISYRIHQV